MIGTVLRSGWCSRALLALGLSLCAEGMVAQAPELLAQFGERRPARGVLSVQTDDGVFREGPLVTLELLRDAGFHQAVQRIEEAGAGGGPAPAPLHDLGVLRLAQGRYDEAVTALDRALLLAGALGEGSPEIANDLAVALLERGLVGGSVGDLLDALERLVAVSEDGGDGSLVRSVEFNRALARSALGLAPFRGLTLDAARRQAVVELVPAKGGLEPPWSLSELRQLVEAPDFLRTHQARVRDSLWRIVEERAAQGSEPLFPSSLGVLLARLVEAAEPDVLADLETRWSQADAEERSRIAADVRFVAEARRAAAGGRCEALRDQGPDRAEDLGQRGSPLEWRLRVALLECLFEEDAGAAWQYGVALLDELPRRYGVVRIEALKRFTEVAIRSGRVGEAERSSAERSRLIREKSGDSARVADAMLRDLGVMASQGLVEESEELWSEALPLLRRVAIGEEWAIARAVLSEHALVGGQVRAARDILLDLRHEASSPSWVWEARIEQARVDLALGRREAVAIRLVRALQDLAEDADLSETRRLEFEIRILATLLEGELVPAQEQSRHARRLEELVERAGRADQEHLLALLRFAGRAGDERIGAIDALLADWAAQGRTLKDMGGTNGSQWEPLLRSVLDALAPVKPTVAAALAELFQQERRGYGAGRFRTSSDLQRRIEEAGSMLAPGSAILITAWGRDALWSFVVTAEGTRARRSAGSRLGVEEAVQSFQRTLLRDDDEALVRATGAGVLDALFPDRSLLDGLMRLHVVPAMGLETISIGTLWDAGGDRYLLSQVASSWLGSIEAPVSEGGGAEVFGSTLLVAGRDFGDLAEALPNAIPEAEAIARLVDEPVLLLGEMAAADRVRREIVQAARVHFAVHARRRDGRGVVVLPATAAIGATEEPITEFMAGGRKQLVFLSACGLTGYLVRGRRSRSSLLDHLVQEAADHLVWTDRPVVDRRASALAVIFYRELVRGFEPAVALARAQRDLLDSGVPPSGWASHHLSQMRLARLR